MFWTIVGIVLLIVLLRMSSSKKDIVYIDRRCNASDNENRAMSFVKMSAIFPDKLKPLLVEEFPQFESTFTTSFCSMILSETVRFSKGRTGESNELMAIQKIEKYLESPESKEKIEREMEAIWKEKFPAGLYSFVHEDATNYTKLDYAVELAMTQTIAELS